MSYTNVEKEFEHSAEKGFIEQFLLVFDIRGEED